MACASIAALSDCLRTGVSCCAPATCSADPGARDSPHLLRPTWGPAGLRSLQPRHSRNAAAEQCCQRGPGRVQCTSAMGLGDAAQNAAAAASQIPELGSAADVASSSGASLAQALELSTMSLAVGVGLPCHFMECGDVAYRSTLAGEDTIKLTVGGLLLFALAAGYLWSTPGVAPGLWDMFVLAPLERRFRPALRKEGLVLGKKLGEGGFGTVYKGQLVGKPGSEVVVKRATEFGAVEAWMNERVRRACPDGFATFLSGFIDKTRYKEDFWLVWQHEGDSTFAKVLETKDFPYNIEEAVLGSVPDEPKGPAREMRVVRRIMRRILESLRDLHATGIVHRDIKPQNMIFNSETGALKIIDLGAAADLRVGINYIPNEFLLDPRYAAPEQYIMSTQTPKAPPPVLATALSPVLWKMNAPDRFDMYSTGLIFLQMVFPLLRPDNGLIQFNRQFKRCDYNLSEWRAQVERRGVPDMMKGFALLDMDGGLGWQLLQSMLQFKGRQRISVQEALLHPFFDPAAPTPLQSLRLAALRLLHRDNSTLSESLATLMARSGTEDVGGFTELSLQKFRRDERKKQNHSQGLAYAHKAKKDLDRTISSTFGGQDPEELAKKEERWWNRWARTLTAKGKRVAAL